MDLKYLSCFQQFQSTLRRTERPNSFIFTIAISNFNPRSDERSDYELVHIDVVQRISIHAPTNGATFCFSHSLHPPVYFNPRSDERSDVIKSALTPQVTYFNPRSDERSDRNVSDKYQYLDISIHAPTNGAT